MWPATLIIKASRCTRTVLSLVTSFQAIEANFAFRCNFPHFVLGLDLKTVQ